MDRTTGQTSAMADESPVGLQDHSEELHQRTQKDARLRFYRAMAAMGSGYTEVLDELARAVAEVVFDLCVVHLVDDDKRFIELQAAFHPNDDVLDGIEQMYAATPQRVDEGIFGRVLETHEAYFQPHWSRMRQRHDTKPEYREAARRLNIHSLIVAPMVTTDGEVIGTLTVGRHNTSTPYDETDLALVEWLANHAAMKVETTRLYHDIQRANDELSQALQVRDTFIAAATHELRTPLTVARLQAQHLFRNCTDEDPSVETLIPTMERMDLHLNRLSGLIDRMLDVCRLCEGTLQLRCHDFDMCRSVEKTVESLLDLLDDADCNPILKLDGPQRGYWDEARIEQIVTNLLTNAARYAPGSPVTVSVTGNQDAVCLLVRDRGPGIPESDQRRIFERFERIVDGDKTPGMGLGLWLVRRYTEAMGGRIGVNSAPGEGAIFTVEIPRWVDS